MKPIKNFEKISFKKFSLMFNENFEMPFLPLLGERGISYLVFSRPIGRESLEVIVMRNVRHLYNLEKSNDINQNLFGFYPCFIGILPRKKKKMIIKKLEKFSEKFENFDGVFGSYSDLEVFIDTFKSK